MLHEAAGAQLAVVADRGGGGGDLAERSPRSTTRGGHPAVGALLEGPGARTAALVLDVAQELGVLAVGGGRLADRGGCGGGSDLAERWRCTRR